ncbi:efflux transporter periplasmic adaptor subunit [Sphingomonas lenta]|uniref:Efflux transporter periplasmic adaptor subunit n=2 Tax=Sphingomonas lenta TaxID=1141887 RepID=A0A2A2SC95_9SPHN|nr:efflux RND transporter periplasmic adaptor subunit [Sphingomonas lenta]PAX06815.1 efflux transporter periplasmic adaptor subunit [Sphingomonas lenta]
MLKRLGLAAALLSLGACGQGNVQAQQQGAPAPTPVGFVTLTQQPVTLTTELPGRTTAFETSEVRPQVNGLVRARLFTEGDYVRQGQPLYRIDPAPYEAQVASARAALARAQAATGSSAALARRYGELVRINAIARQEYENAVTASNQTRADVAAQQAALRQAQIDLGRTTIRAPISGRIGRSIFTTGALVSAAQAEPLATIQRLDPVFVDIQQSSADLLRLREQMMAGNLSRGGGARVRLRLESGSVYPIEGTLRFADVTVDPTTGSQTIRAVFPNPNGLLLPGMFVRAELVEGVQSQGILVPQRAVTRDERGRATVMVVGRGDRAEPRTIQTSRTVGDAWLVTGGVAPGDRVIVEGAMMLRPGMPVQPRPFGSRPAAAPASTPAVQAK